MMKGVFKLLMIPLHTGDWGIICIYKMLSSFNWNLFYNHVYVVCHWFMQDFDELVVTPKLLLELLLWWYPIDRYHWHPCVLDTFYMDMHPIDHTTAKQKERTTCHEWLPEFQGDHMHNPFMVIVFPCSNQHSKTTCIVIVLVAFNYLSHTAHFTR